ncbi:putative quinol monooxygenase [Streptomyces griseorubiginosus]
MRAEPGYLPYDLNRVSGEPDRFVLIDRWASK